MTPEQEVEEALNPPFHIPRNGGVVYNNETFMAVCGLTVPYGQGVSSPWYPVCKAMALR